MLLEVVSLLSEIGWCALVHVIEHGVHGRLGLSLCSFESLRWTKNTDAEVLRLVYSI